MTPIELLALTKLLQSKKDAIRSQVSSGDYSVDFSVHVKGELEVLEDTEKSSTVSVPWTEVYALLREILLQGVDELVARVDRGETVGKEDLEGFRRACGLSEELLVKTIEEAWEIKNNRKGRGEIKNKIPEIQEAQKRALDAISRRLPKTHVNGAVKANLTVDEIVPVQNISSTVLPSEENVAGKMAQEV